MFEELTFMPYITINQDADSPNYAVDDDDDNTDYEFFDDGEDEKGVMEK